MTAKLKRLDQFQALNEAQSEGPGVPGVLSFTLAVSRIKYEGGVRLGCTDEISCLALLLGFEYEMCPTDLRGESLAPSWQRYFGSLWEL